MPPRHLLRPLLIPEPPDKQEDILLWLKREFLPALVSSFDDHTHTFPSIASGENRVKEYLEAGKPTAQEGGAGAVIFVSDAAISKFQGSDGTTWLGLVGGPSSFATPSITFATTYGPGTLGTVIRSDAQLKFPTSLMSTANSTTLTLTDTGSDQVLNGNFGQIRTLSDWWFGSGVGIGTFAQPAVYALTVFRSSSAPIAFNSISEATDANLGVGFHLQAQTDVVAGAIGRLTGAELGVAPRGAGKAFLSPDAGLVSSLQGQGTDATSTLGTFRGFAAIDVGGDPLTVTNWIGFEQDVQTTYGTNVWGIRTANRAEFQSPSAKATTVLLLRQLATGATAGAHLNLDDKAGDPPSPNTGDLWRSGDGLKFRNSLGSWRLDGYSEVQDEGVGFSVRNKLNFVGAGVTVGDDAINNRTDITIAGGGGAPVGASYLALALDGALTAERRFVDGLGLTAVDGGANGDYTLDWDGLTVRKNTGADVGTRRRLNLIEGSNVTLTVADDGAGGEIDVTVAAAAGGSAALTQVEVDLGSTPRRAGKFTISDGSIVAGNQMIVTQQAGPYTGKGSRADEAEMDQLWFAPIVTGAGAADVYWTAADRGGPVQGNFKVAWVQG